MKFVTYSISTKTKPKTLSEMFKAAQTQAALSKTASSKKEEVKVAEVVAPAASATPVTAPKAASKAVKQEVKVAEDGEKKGKGGASDEAESSGQLKVEPLHQKGESTQEKPGDLDTQKKNEKEAGSPAGPAKKDEGDAESSGQLKVEPLHQEGESTQEKPGDLDTQKKDEKKAKAAQPAKKADFTVTAELTPKEKDFLRSVWSNFWTKKFIDAVLGAGPGA